MKIENISFIDILTTTMMVEAFMIYLFRYTLSPFSGVAINNWYTNFKWSAVILDILSFMIGFYLAKYVYKYLLKDKFGKDYVFLKFLFLVLAIQIIHDFGFYFFVIKNSKIGKNKIIDELLSYSKNIGVGAVIGDSFMYLIGTPILFYIVNKISNDNKIFLSIFLLYIIGYFIYEKPLVK